MRYSLVSVIWVYCVVVYAPVSGTQDEEPYDEELRDLRDDSNDSGDLQDEKDSTDYNDVEDDGPDERANSSSSAHSSVAIYCIIAWILTYVFSVQLSEEEIIPSDHNGYVHKFSDARILPRILKSSMATKYPSRMQGDDGAQDSEERSRTKIMKDVTEDNLNENAKLMMTAFSLFELYNDKANKANDKMGISIMGNWREILTKKENVLTFIALGGFDKILVPALNSSIDNVRDEAIGLISVMIEREFKEKVFKDNVHTILIKFLDRGNFKEAKILTLKALKELCKDNPEGQKSTLESGERVFRKLLMEADDVKIKLEVVKLVLEMAKEVMAFGDCRKCSPEKLELFEKYKSVGIIEKVSTQKSCQIVSDLLIDNYGADPADLDDIRSTVDIFALMQNSCHSYKRYKSKVLQNTLEKIQGFCSGLKTDYSRKVTAKSKELNICKVLSKRIPKILTGFRVIDEF